LGDMGNGSGSVHVDYGDTVVHPRNPVEEPIGLLIRLLWVISSPVLAVALVIRVIAALLVIFVFLPICMWVPRCVVFCMLPCFARIIYFSFGVYPGMIEIRGQQADVPVMVVAPHSGAVELLFGMYFCRPMPKAVMMETYTKLPIIGYFFRLLGGLAVPLPAAGTKAEAQAEAQREQQQQQQSTAEDPENAAIAATPKKPTRAAAIREAIKEHKSQWRPGMPAIGIAPEGTTTNGRVLIKFFTGAFEGGGRVQPVLIQYPYVYWNATAFIDGGFGKHIRNLLLNPWQRVVVTFLPATEPAAEEEAEAAVYAERVRRDMGAAAGLPLSDYTAKMLRDEDRKHVAL